MFGGEPQKAKVKLVPKQWVPFTYSEYAWHRLKPASLSTGDTMRSARWPAQGMKVI
jgi:hypothetical protein